MRLFLKITVLIGLLAIGIVGYSVYMTKAPDDGASEPYPPKEDPKANRESLPPEVRTVMNAPGKTTVTLYSVGSGETSTAGPTKLGYSTLGKVELTEAQASDAMKYLVEKVDNWTGGTAMCYTPRHCLSFKSNGYLYDILICYDCEQFWVLRNGAPTHKKLIVFTSKDRNLRKEQAKLLNDILTAASVPLPR